MKCSDEHWSDKMSPENAPLLDSRGPEVLCPETQRALRLSIQLFLKLPSNINYMHPFRNLGVCFIFPQKVPPFTSSQRQVQSYNCKTRTGSGRKKPGQ